MPFAFVLTVPGKSWEATCSLAKCLKNLSKQV